MPLSLENVFPGRFGSVLRVAVELVRPADTTAYAASDSVSNSTSAPTVLTFDDVARGVAGSGYIVGVRVLTDKDAITPTLRVHFFRETVAAINDNAAFTQPSYANADKYIGHIDVGPLSSSASGAATSYDRNISTRLPYTLPAAGDSIFALIETRDAFTPASGQKFSIALWTDND